MLKCLVIFCILTIVVLVTPFIGFGKCYYAVAADAARMFGIYEHEYRITFYRGRLLNAAGESVSGTFTLTRDGAEDTRIFTIRVRRYISRPMTIATIFHEFAHAAQYKFNLICDRGYFNGRYNREQHAEVLAFNKMWQSGFWWNSIHMLTMHTFWGKPSEYRAPRTLWRTFLTGSSTVL